MKNLRSILHRLRGLFRRRSLEAEMNEELRAHLEGLVERNVAAGMSAEEARFAAMREFGGVEQIKERSRDERRSAWGEHLLQDVRYGVRQLRKTPGFTAVAVFSLALGIGANIAMFGWFDGMVLRPLPVQNPDELLLLGWQRTGQKGDSNKGGGGDVDVPETDQQTGQRIGRLFSWSTFERLRARTADLPVKDVLAVAHLSQPVFTIDGQPERIASGNLVSGNYHAMLGVAPAIGRTLQPGDDRPGAEGVAVISHGYWQRRFTGDPAVVGRTVLLNRTPVTIVGVTSPGFFGAWLAGGPVDITVPLSLTERVYPEADEMPMRDPGFWWLRIFGRLKPNATPEQAQAGLEGVFREAAADGWNNPNELPRLVVNPAGYGRTERARQNAATALMPLIGMVALLLLVACANLANLLLARGAARRRELAVRLALGAGRARLVRQLFVESMLLALIGSAAGILVAVWGVEALSLLAARPEDREMFVLQIDWRIAGCSVGLAAITAALSGLVPAWRATRLDLSGEFQGGARTLGGARSKLNRVLMIVQVALSLVLLVTAGLLGRTVHNLLAVDIGFNRERLLLFSLEGVPAGYAEGPRLEAFYRTAAERIAAIGGVSGVTFSRTPVLSRHPLSGLAFDVVGGASIEPQPQVRRNEVEARFFEVYQMSFLLGRGFTPQDSATAPKVVVVNQTLAEKFFPGENPLGRRVSLGRGRNQRQAEIVGVVRDFREVDMRRETLPVVYVPVAQSGAREAHFAVRTAGAPEALIGPIRKAVAEIDPHVPLANIRTQATQIEWTVIEEKIIAYLATFLGFGALMLATIGLYGLMSYGVVRRTGEIGLRIALDALPRQMLAMILRESIWLVAVGICLGIAGALAVVRLLATKLYGLSATDPLTYAAVALLLLSIGAIAALLPARRAAKVDPMIALRAE